MTPDEHRLGAAGNVRGAVAMTLGMLGFVTNDMLIKIASATLPTGQIIFIRGVVTTAVISAIVVATGHHRRIIDALRPSVGLRTLGELLSTIFFLTALFHIPIANATAILQAVPIVITAVAAVFLKEHVGWRRWLAVLVGFAGMLMIVQPGGAGFNVYALFAVAAVFTMTLRDLSTRFIPLAVPAILVTLVASVAVMAMGAAIGPFESWVWPSPYVFALLIGSGISLTAGYFFLVEAMRSGEISAISPFRYTILIPAFIYGIVVFGEVPVWLEIAGIVLVAASGLFVFYRERRVSAEPRSAATAPR